MQKVTAELRVLKCIIYEGRGRRSPHEEEKEKNCLGKSPFVSNGPLSMGFYLKSEIFRIHLLSFFFVSLFLF